MDRLSHALIQNQDRKTQVSKATPGPPTQYPSIFIFHHTAHLTTRVFAVDWAIPFPSGLALVTVAVLVIVVPALAVTFT
jgi:hypothetical protein